MYDELIKVLGELEMIGIFTFWGVPNYGAFCQAYALNKVISSVTEEEVKHIGYLNSTHKALYWNRHKPVANGYKSFFSPNYHLGKLLFYISPNMKYPNFEESWDMIPHLNFNNEDELEKFKFRNIILGSDSIWEYSTLDFGNDKHFVGINLNADKINAYAPSFGDMSIDDYFDRFIADGIRRLDIVSVRDRSSVDIVRELIGVEPPIVLDPTFLWDFNRDKNIKSLGFNNYILVYGDNFDDAIVKQVKNYAYVHKLKVVGAGIAPKWCDVRLTKLTPFEWIGLFRDASLVVTCTFHGLMFSIHCKKKVLFQQIEHVKNRSQWLLEETGLDKIYFDLSLDKVLDAKWDYEEIYHRLEPQKNESLEILKSMLS